MFSLREGAECESYELNGIVVLLQESVLTKHACAFNNVTLGALSATTFL